MLTLHTLAEEPEQIQVSKSADHSRPCRDEEKEEERWCERT